MSLKAPWVGMSMTAMLSLRLAQPCVLVPFPARSDGNAGLAMVFTARLPLPSDESDPPAPATASGLLGVLAFAAAQSHS